MVSYYQNRPGVQAENIGLKVDKDPTSFNTNGQFELFKEILTLLLCSGCKLNKEQQTFLMEFQTQNICSINRAKHKRSQKVKKIVNAIFYHFVDVIAHFRDYDKA